MDQVSEFSSTSELQPQLFGLKSTQVDSPNDLASLLPRIIKCLENTSNNRKQRYLALKLLASTIESCLNNETLHAHFQEMITKQDALQQSLGNALMLHMKDNRNDIVKQTSHVIQILSSVLSKKFTKVSKRILPTLLQTLGVVNDSIRQHTIDSIVKIIEHCHAYAIFEAIYKTFQKTKNADIERSCIIFFKIIIRVWPIKNLLKQRQCEEFETFINLGLTAKSSETRHIAAVCFWYYVHSFPKRLNQIYSAMPPRRKSIVMKEKQSLSEFESLDSLTSTSFFTSDRKSQYQSIIRSSNNSAIFYNNSASPQVSTRQSAQPRTKASSEFFYDELPATLPVHLSPKQLQEKETQETQQLVENEEATDPTDATDATEATEETGQSQTTDINGTNGKDQYKRDETTANAGNEAGTNIESIFKINPDEFLIQTQSEFSKLACATDKLDERGICLHNGWNEFKSQTFRALRNIEVIINQVNNEDDMTPMVLRSAVDELNQHKENVDVAIQTFQSCSKK